MKEENMPADHSKKEQRRREYEKEIYENWQSKRENGKWDFIWRFGVFSWGVTTFAFYWVIMFILGKLTNMGLGFNLQTLIQILFSLVTFVVFGIFYGLFLWKKNENIFTKKYPYGRNK